MGQRWHGLPFHVKQLRQRLRELLRERGFTLAQVGSAASVILVSVLLARRAARRRPKPLAPIALSAAMQLMRDKKVQELIYTDGGTIIIALKEAARYATHLVPGSEASLFRLACEAEVPSVRYQAQPRSLLQALSTVLPLVVVYVWYRAVKSLISKEEKYTPPRTLRNVRQTITFADVVSRSKVELKEIVDYLNNPQRFREAGARLPRGALLVGPSGTGKTLLAKAVAGEADCSFISTSASEFVEVYVGRGAARVRDLFRQAREAAPAVLFIDELDALGSRSRAGDFRAQNEEYIQTLNQLLTEMDGFHGQSDGIVVIAATNRHEAIDSSLVRPGRFDRHVFVELPDEGERLEILKIHAKRAPMMVSIEAEVLDHIANQTSGYSGADLANIVNEALFLAMRTGSKRVARQDMVAALNRARNTRQRAAGVAESKNGSLGPNQAHQAMTRTLLGRHFPGAAAVVR
mmetsp:Transcript_100829/g.178911  ORF Transcript_100829/g.178911 Transcript_100829/m.178911 type:complete len:463 (+) Transcript_100829:65-1453(+)